jgi:DNA processing protein
MLSSSTVNDIGHDLEYWVAFNRVRGIGPVRFQALLDRFGDLGEAWKATELELQAAGLDSRSAGAVAAARRDYAPEAEMERLLKAGVSVVTWRDVRYPELLRTIHASPPVLYVKGELRTEDGLAVAVVGTRTATQYGLEVTRLLAGGLARNGVTVVSGLALGVDGEAHSAALDARGRTIAVLGSGLDVVYPPRHEGLARRVAEGGALVSEYGLGVKPEAGNFPARNRIISGLSLGVVVVEADTDSGSLITARLANEQGRDVFAVPGSILRPGCRGTNDLIREGAKPVLSVNDILEELNLSMVPQQAEVRETLPADENEAKLLKSLTHDPTHVDDLSRVTGLPIAVVSSALTMMELKGAVRHVGGMAYVLAR